jgi:predicted lipoprotein with Yx(FWY)xxD motif
MAKAASSSKQFPTALRGWPLYYYSGDIKPEDMNGQGIGGAWAVATLNITMNSAT